MAKNKELGLTAQPQALEAEQAVLGSMLTSKEAVSKAMQCVSTAQFYKDAHVRIFTCLVNLFEKGEHIDAIPVVDRLQKKTDLDSVGGAYYITCLAESVPPHANVDH